MRVAIVHDWLTNLGGAERVVEAMLEAYPEADLYTSVYDDRKLDLFRKHQVRTSFLQRVPLAKRKHQLFPILRRYAFEAFDFSQYDVVITSSTAEAKGVITSEGTLHASYINTPTRYYWSHYDEYLKSPGFGVLDPLVRWQLERTIEANRRWDFAAAQRADIVFGNSQTVVDRIEKYYQRKARVLYPNVETHKFQQPQPRPSGLPEKYFLVVSRLIPYKRVDIAIEAAVMSGTPLVVIGSGGQLPELKKLADDKVIFVGALDDRSVVAHMQHAEAFVFPGEEDFGITPVESMAAGVPVIGYARGGVAETIIDGETGILVDRQTATAFAKAFHRYQRSDYAASALAAQAEKFRRERFITELRSSIDQALKQRV